MKGLSRQTRIMLLVVALILFAVAIIWSISTNNTGELSRIVNLVNSYGYSVDIEDIYPSDAENDTTIAEMIAKQPFDAIVEKSKASGFPSDINKRGDIVQLLIPIDETQVITLFIIDAKVELAFIQVIGTDEVLKLGE